MDAIAPFSPTDVPAPLQELSIVRLLQPMETKDGTLPAGASGTVVHALGGGKAYLIEFLEPFHCVAMVEADAAGA